MNDKQTTMVDFKQLSEFGLIHLINKQVLHPLGLALSYILESGESKGAIISPDLSWEFSPETDKQNDEALKKFLKNRESILQKLLLKAQKDR